MYSASYLDDCRRLRDGTLAVMRDNLRLKELMLFRCGEAELSLEDLWDMDSLETLVVRECERVDVARAELRVRQLANLRHLNLMGCLWVTDELVRQVASLKQL